MKRYQNRPILSDRKTQISGSHVRICFYSWNYSFLCYYFGRNGFSDLEIMEIDKNFLKIAWKLIDLEDFLNRHQLKAVGSPKNTKNPLNWSILNRFSKFLCLYPVFQGHWIHFCRNNSRKRNNQIFFYGSLKRPFWKIAFCRHQLIIRRNLADLTLFVPWVKS